MALDFIFEAYFNVVSQKAKYMYVFRHPRYPTCIINAIKWIRLAIAIKKNKLSCYYIDLSVERKFAVTINIGKHKRKTNLCANFGTNRQFFPGWLENRFWKERKYLWTNVNKIPTQPIYHGFLYTKFCSVKQYV